MIMYKVFNNIVFLQNVQTMNTWHEFKYNFEIDTSQEKLSSAFGQT